MNTYLLFSAERKVDHEFLLASLAMKAVHRMHRPGVRTEDTMSRVFSVLAKGEPVDLPPEVEACGLTVPVPKARFEGIYLGRGTSLQAS
jgi:hypothetical protein